MTRGEEIKARYAFNEDNKNGVEYMRIWWATEEIEGGTASTTFIELLDIWSRHRLGRRIS